jgi:glycosyltransferase involved in cell wall biosynthesis
MESLRLAVSTQTPLIRFRDGSRTSGRTSVRLGDLREPDDYKFTTGGVTRMLLPLLRGWVRHRAAETADWVALAAGEAAPRVDVDGVRLSFVRLRPSEQRAYAAAKERLWQLLNSGPAAPAGAKPPPSAWDGFDLYQARSAEALQEAAPEADLLYVHDFQQLGVGDAWPPRASASRARPPAVFQLHTPYPSTLPREWDAYFADRLSRYQAVVVSTRRYAENLRRAGMRAPLHVVPPFVDPRDYPDPAPGARDELRERFHLPEGDRVVLHVGRMDPMKGQDRLLKAMPALLRAVPDARLVLVGNGSFSSSKKGGLGLSKGQQWRAALEALARDLGVEGRVTFTGHLGDDLLPAAFDRCDVFCLPSTREGFGLAAIEAWLRGKPVVVSDRAGVAELVDGENGLALDCGDGEALAAALASLLRDPDRARAMGRAGAKSAEIATLPAGARALERLFDAVLSREEVPRVA